MWGNGDTFGGGFGGGGAGGGFMNNTVSSPSGGKADKGPRKPLNIFPVTIRQLLECPDDNFRIEDTEAHTLTIVGLVRKVDITTTRISFILDDQTGSIEAINYVGTDDMSSEPETVLIEGTYGRVVGSLRVQRGGQKYIVIYKVFPVTDMNELTCHNLEVVQVPLKLKKLKEMEARKTGMGFGGGMDNTFNNTMVGGGFGGGGGGGVGSNPTSGGGQGVFKPLENRIISYIKQHQGEAGVHQDQIGPGMGISQAQVIGVITSLSGEGHIYSTNDEDTWMVTD